MGDGGQGRRGVENNLGVDMECGQNSSFLRPSNVNSTSQSCQGKLTGPVASISSVTSVASTVEIICPYCSRTYRSAEEVIHHSLSAHPRKAIVAELATRGYKVS